jgi:hypothetical protein
MDSKRLIIMAFCTICLSSCNPLFWLFEDDGEGGEDTEEPIPSPYTEWRLKNATMETIVLDYPIRELHKLITIPQEIDTLIGWSRISDTDNFFDTFWSEAKGDSAFIKLNGEIVRVWRYDEKDIPGKQFFNKSSWIKLKSSYNESPYTIWTFEITPEDIVSP